MSTLRSFPVLKLPQNYRLFTDAEVFTLSYVFFWNICVCVTTKNLIKIVIRNCLNSSQVVGSRSPPPTPPEASSIRYQVSEKASVCNEPQIALSSAPVSGVSTDVQSMNDPDLMDEYDQDQTAGLTR